MTITQGEVEERAANADRAGRLEATAVTELVDRGFARWFVPIERGGAARGFTDLLQEVSDLGRGCTSTAWTASVLAFGGRYVALMADAAQADVWADGPDARVVASIKPQGQAERVDDGLVLSGSWSYVSGVEASDWLLVSTPGGPPGGAVPPSMALVPRRAYEIVPDWESFGMRATASHSVRLEGVHVPDHRVASRAQVMGGRAPGGAAPAIPSTAVNGITFVAPALGAALGALVEAESAFRVPATGPRVHAVASLQVEYARAAARVDAAQLLLRRLAAAADAGEVAGEALARSRRDATFALEEIVRAVDGCLRVSGTRGTTSGTSIERRWRDVHSIASHAVMQFEPAAMDYTETRVEASR